jgi:hypothetical protein
MSNTPIYDALWAQHTAALGHAPGKGPKTAPAAPVKSGRSNAEMNAYYEAQAAMDDKITGPNPVKKAAPRKKKK